MAIAGYPGSFMEYGYTPYGARAVAVASQDAIQLKKVVFSIIWARFYLAIVAVPAAVIAAMLFPETANLYTVVNIVIMAVVNGFSVEWYQRGLERNKVVAILHIIGRCSAVPATFMFVQDASHINRLLLINTLSMSVPYIGSMVLVIIERGWQNAHFSDVKHVLYDARHFFYFAIASSAASSIISIIMTKLLSPTETGYWATALRIQGPFWAIVSPLLTATFPRVAMRMAQSPVEGMKLARKITMLSVLGALGMAIVLAILAYPALLFLAGNKYMASLPTIWILSGYLPIMALSSSLSFMYLYPLKLEKYIIRLVLISVFVNVLVFMLLYKYISHNAAAVSLLAGELAKVSYSLTLIRKAYRQNTTKSIG